MSLIKIGLEASRKQLCKELISHPGRYFLVSVSQDRAALSIETCDGKGENLLCHILDVLAHDSDGNLVSVFEKELYVSMKDIESLENASSKIGPNGEVLYPISAEIAEKIESLPEFIDWIISSVLAKDRNILINPAAWS
jgi:hypothetical protein